MNKVIFLDVDGTLVDYANNLPASAVEAIGLAQKKGNFVYLCTGRSKGEKCEELMELTHPDGIICANGAYVEKNGEVLFHKTLNPEWCREVVDYLNEKGLAFYEESNDESFASETFLSQAGPYLASYMGVEFNENTDTKDLVSVFFPAMHYDAPLYNDDLIKISYTLPSWDTYYDMKEKFPQFHHGTWGGTTAVPAFGDVCDINITKADGIDIIISATGCRLEDTFAFGDAKYDIPMFERCATGVAMGNGDDTVKAAADYVTDDVANDGLYNAFLHFNLI